MVDLDGWGGKNYSGERGRNSGIRIEIREGCVRRAMNGRNDSWAPAAAA